MSRVKISWKSFCTPATNISGLLVFKYSNRSVGSAKQNFPTAISPNRERSCMISLSSQMLTPISGGLNNKSSIWDNWCGKVIAGWRSDNTLSHSKFTVSDISQSSLAFGFISEECFGSVVEIVAVFFHAIIVFDAFGCVDWFGHETV